MTSRPARIGRLGWFLLMMIGVGLIVVLYSIKTRALQAKAQVKQLEYTLAREKAEVQMLGAEIAHLENPERLRTLGSTHLDLHPVDAERVLDLEQAAKQIPKRLASEQGTPP